MKNKKQTNCKSRSHRYILFIILLFAAIIICSALGKVSGVLHVRAEGDAASKYTAVMDDLAKDEYFNADDYPAVANDYSIRIIQIAESSDAELFVYTYQPSVDERFVLTSIRLSTEKGNMDSRHDYALVECNHDGPLYKYKVVGLLLVDNPIRYYDITAVFRKWIPDVDDETGNDNTIDYVPYAVGQLWTVVDTEDKTEYMLQYIDVIVVTEKYVDFLRYKEGFRLFKNNFCDSHYIAFSPEHDIDTLQQAKVSFICGEYWMPGDLTKLSAEDIAILEQANSIRPNGESQSHEVKFNADDLTKQGTYRIESVDDFVNSEELSDKVKESVKPKEWILRFCETPVQVNKYGPVNNPVANKSYFMRVSEVTILELTFETNGVVYNLGVVDNKQTGDLLPGGDEGDDGVEGMLAWFKNLFEKIAAFFRKYWYWFVIGAVAFIALIILAPFMPSIIHLIFSGIVWLFKGLVWLVSLPIRGIVALIRKIQGNSK